VGRPRPLVTLLVQPLLLLLPLTSHTTTAMEHMRSSQLISQKPLRLQWRRHLPSTAPQLAMTVRPPVLTMGAHLPIMVIATTTTPQGLRHTLPAATGTPRHGIA